MRRWFRGLRRAARKGGPSRRSGIRPAVEILEDRCLLDAGYLQTNLVSDVPGLATSTDPNLKNPWGLVAAGTSGPWWISDNNAGVSTLYNGAGQGFPIGSPLVVNIPTATGGASGGSPSGIVFNGSQTDFVVSQGGKSGPALFIFATEDGTISGWAPGVSFTDAVVAVNTNGAAQYEGLALASNGSATFLYAANQNGGIDIFDTSFHQVGTVNDPDVPRGYAPYGIQNINGKLYITYANQNVAPTPGDGLVDVFNPATGKFHRLITGGKLDLPWGMVIAPSDFGPLSGDLLVGNVGDGHIDAYDPDNGAFVGQLKDTSGNPFTVPGLWSLKFGNGGLAGDSDTLFFTAGINGYADGLFGSLQVPRHPAPTEHINEPILPNLPASPALFVSTVPPNGDVNPYGIAFVPQGFAKGGALNPGDLLVSNFNNSNNLQGTGTTIVRITPSGQTSVFFQGPSTPGALGLTTALGVLKSGFVIVGSVPTLDGTSGTVQAPGSLLILDSNGHVVSTLTDSALLDGPWDLTVNDEGSHAEVFVSNVLSGTVTRIDLTIPQGGSPIVESETRIASGYLTRTDPTALLVGPTGLAYDAQHDILYVASTGDNEIFAIPHAAERTSDAGMGRLVYQDNVHLHGPLGLVLAPNGDLISAQGDAVNPDPKQPSELVEFTPTGHFVGQVSLNPGEGAAFGLALQFTEPGDELNFAAVDDNTNAVHVWTLDLSSKHRGGADRVRQDAGGAGEQAAIQTGGSALRTVGTDLLPAAVAAQQTGGSQGGSIMPAAPGRSSPAPAQTGGQPLIVQNPNSESASRAAHLSAKAHRRAVDWAFADGLGDRF